MKKFLGLLIIAIMSMLILGCDSRQEILETEKVIESSKEETSLESSEPEEILESSKVEKVLESIYIKSVPEKTVYNRNETLNTAGLVIIAVYSDGTWEQLESDFIIQAPDLSEIGTKTVTVSYGEKTTRFEVFVQEAILDSISVATNPTKISYYEGDTLETSGLTLTASYSDNTTETITSGFNCNPTILSGTGSKTITVSYEGKTATFTVTVSAVTLTSIAIATSPSKTTYTVGETLDTSGLALTATYSNGKTETITSGFTVDTTTLSEEGTKTVTVSYGGKSITYTVSVEKAQTTSVAVGDTITFGNLTWRVLAVNGTKALLITKDIVTTKAYNDTYTNVTWETCTLRTWLNSTFLTTYIPSSTDRAKIITTTVVNDDNPDYGIEGGNTTYDKVFLLSIAEAKAYFSSNSDRVAYYNGSSYTWWLRSPGFVSYYAALGDSGGYVYNFGLSVFLSSGVRPALWVDFGS